MSEFTTEHQKMMSNSYIRPEFRNKLFRLCVDKPYGIIAGYVIHEQDNNFAWVKTTQLITTKGTYPISMLGLWGFSCFAPHENLDWLDTPEILTEFKW